MWKILLILLCTLPVVTVHAAVPLQATDDCDCTARNQALLDEAIESLLKSYRLNPDDPVTKYYLFTACTRQWLCINSAYLALSKDARNTPNGLKLREALLRLIETLRELDDDLHPLVDTPPVMPIERADKPAVRGAVTRIYGGPILLRGPTSD